MLSSDINLKWSIQKKERHGINSPAPYSLDFAFPMSMKGLGRGYSPMCLLKSAMSSTTQGCKRQKQIDLHFITATVIIQCLVLKKENQIKINENSLLKNSYNMVFALPCYKYYLNMKHL